MKNDLPYWQIKLQGLLWSVSDENLPLFKRVALQAARILYRVISDLTQGQLTLRAMSLVYTTLLSLVPLLALSFSVLKAFGVHNQLEPMLMNFFVPLGEKGTELASQIVHFVENMNVGVLGSLGLVLLIYTVVSLIQKIESAFNFIWHVSSLRSLVQRLSGYLSVVMVGPMLVVTALGITASVVSTSIVRELIAIEPFGMLFYVVSKLMPYVLVIGAFTATYMIIPNTAVRFRSAIIGGIVSGILWESVGWGFASFIVGSAKYEAVYSGFAIVILFLVWLYLNWLVLLIGASIAFYHQYPAYQRTDGYTLSLGSQARAALALEILRRTSIAYHRGDRQMSVPETLATDLSLPWDTVNEVIQHLLSHGLLVSVDDKVPYLLPGRDPEAITIKEVLDVMQGVPGTVGSQPLFAHAEVQDLLSELDAGMEKYLHGKTVDMLCADGGGSSDDSNDARTTDEGPLKHSA